MAINWNVRPRVFVGFGQSGWHGHGSANAPQDADMSTEEGVFVWCHNNTNPELGSFKQVGPLDADWPWRVDDRANPGIGYSWMRAERKVSDGPVMFISSSAGGQPINEFLPGGNGQAPYGVQWKLLMQKCMWAKRSPMLSHIGNSGFHLADGCGVHQGEADSNSKGTTGAQWQTRFEAVINNLRTPQPEYDNMVVLGAATPVLVGELFVGGHYSDGTPSDDRNVEIRKYETGRDPFIINVRSDNLRSYDSIHIGNRDNDHFGRHRYFNAFRRAPKTYGVS